MMISTWSKHCTASAIVSKKPRKQFVTVRLPSNALATLRWRYRLGQMEFDQQAKTRSGEETDGPRERGSGTSDAYAEARPYSSGISDPTDSEIQSSENARGVGDRGIFSRFRQILFSSLTRRIVFLNLSALAVLLSGILYLNQFREGANCQGAKMYMLVKVTMRAATRRSVSAFLFFNCIIAFWSHLFLECEDQLFILLNSNIMWYCCLVIRSSTLLKYTFYLLALPLRT